MCRERERERRARVLTSSVLRFTDLPAAAKPRTPHRETRSSLKPYPPRETNRRNQRHAKTVLHPSYVYTNRSIINSIVTTHVRDRERQRRKERKREAQTPNNAKYQTSLQTQDLRHRQTTKEGKRDWLISSILKGDVVKKKRKITFIINIY